MISPSTLKRELRITGSQLRIQEVPKRKTVLIVGAGTAGLTIANRLQDHFAVTVVDKSCHKALPWIYKIPMMIGLVFRSDRLDHVTKRELTLDSGRKIPFYESNLLGGASAMNGCVHVFGFKERWKKVLERFGISIESLKKSNDDIYSYDCGITDKITLMHAHQNIIDRYFCETLNLRDIKTDDMSYTENQACGPIQNTVRKRFRTSVLSFAKAREFKCLLNKKVESLMIDEQGFVKGIRTSKSEMKADHVILSAGVIGSCDLLLREKDRGLSKQLRGLPVGENIQDHTNLRVNVVATEPIGSMNEIADSVLKKISLGFKHTFGISTVLRGTGATSAAYLDLDGDGEIDTRLQILQFAETGRHASNGSLFGSNQPSFSISINTIFPESRGSITLDGEDNVVDPCFLQNDKDIQLLKLAVAYSIDLLKAPPLNNYVKRIEHEDAMCNDPEKYIRDTMYSGHHLIGGLHDVIDRDFNVKNTKGLSVCDASVFDQYVASNIHSSVLLLADVYAKKFLDKNLSA